jgi:hypothetical protein
VLNIRKKRDKQSCLPILDVYGSNLAESECRQSVDPGPVTKQVVGQHDVEASEGPRRKGLIDVRLKKTEKVRANVDFQVPLNLENSSVPTRVVATNFRSLKS